MSNLILKKEDTKKEIINLYTEKPQKFLARGKIKQSTLDKIMEDINANCKKKTRD